MMHMPDHRPIIIQSLLDTDLYKFTMLQVVLHQFPQAVGVYEFRCRNNHETVYPLGELEEELNIELDRLCHMKFTQDELLYLRSLRFIKSDFVDYLELFQLKRRFIHVSTDEQQRLNIRIEGPIIQAMFLKYSSCPSSTNCISAVLKPWPFWLKVKSAYSIKHNYYNNTINNNTNTPLHFWYPTLAHAAAIAFPGKDMFWKPYIRQHRIFCAAPAMFIWPKN